MSDVGHPAETLALQCVEANMEAYRACMMTLPYCIQQGGDLATPARLQVLHDCADLNLAVANFLARGSRFHKPLAELCIDVSRACAEALADIEHSDPQLRIVYAACQRVAQACHSLTASAETEASRKRDEALRETFPASDPTPTPTEL